MTKTLNKCSVFFAAIVVFTCVIAGIARAEFFTFGIGAPSSMKRLHPTFGLYGSEADGQSLESQFGFHEMSRGGSVADGVIRGQRQPYRRGGGGVFRLGFYAADTVMDDARYSNVQIKPDILGGLIGYDMKIGHKGLGWLGFFYNYNNNYTQWKVHETEYSMRWKDDCHLFGITYTKYGSIAHIFLKGSVGYDIYDTVLPDLQLPDEMPRPHWTGNGLQAGLYAELGLDLVPGSEAWELKPYVALDYNYLNMDDLGDKSGYNSLPGNDYQAFKSLLGFRLNRNIKNIVILQGRVAWIQQLLKDCDPIYTLYYSEMMGQSTPIQYFYNGDVGRSWVALGFGTKWLYRGIRLQLNYDAMLNEYHRSHTFSTGILFTW